MNNLSYPPPHESGIACSVQSLLILSKSNASCPAFWIGLGIQKLPNFGIYVIKFRSNHCNHFWSKTFLVGGLPQILLHIHTPYSICFHFVDASFIKTMFRIRKFRRSMLRSRMEVIVIALTEIRHSEF